MKRAGHIGTAVAVTMVVLVGAVCPVARAQDAAPAIPPGTTADAIWRDIETFRMLYRLRLTSEQAQAWLQRAEPLQAALDQSRGRNNSPAALAVMMEIRQAALKGLPATDDMWERLAKAVEAVGGHDDEESDLEKGTRELAISMAEALTDQQVSDLTRSDVLDEARGMINEARDVMAAPKETWNNWVEANIDQYVANRPEVAEDAEDKLAAFFAKLRDISGDDLDEQMDKLVVELAEVLEPVGTPEEMRASAAERLTDELLYNAGLLTCLKEYAVVAAGG